MMAYFVFVNHRNDAHLPNKSTELKVCTCTVPSIPRENGRWISPLMLRSSKKNILKVHRRPTKRHAYRRPRHHIFNGRSTIEKLKVEREAAMESPPDNDVCSVCHDNFSLPCQANCSHWFCGKTLKP